MHILIVGGDGAIGAALADALRAGNHRVTSTTRRRHGEGTAKTIFFDLAAPDVEVLPDADVAVICAAMARFEDCRTKRELAQQVNVAAPAAIAAYMRKKGKRVVLLSSSVVFDCLAPKRKADEPCSPRSAYGRFKADAERAVLSIGQGMTVLRLTKVVHTKAGLLPGWIAAMAEGRPITAFGDHGLCPLPMTTVTAALVAILTQAGDGIFQVSGADDLTYAAAARELAAELGVPASLVMEVAAGSAGVPAEEVTPFTSLDTARLSALNGYVPPKACDVLRDVYGSQLSRGSARSSAAR